jgi:hypothetical protein
MTVNRIISIAKIAIIAGNGAEAAHAARLRGLRNREWFYACLSGLLPSHYPSIWRGNDAEERTFQRRAAAVGVGPLTCGETPQSERHRIIRFFGPPPCQNHISGVPPQNGHGFTRTLAFARLSLLMI